MSTHQTDYPVWAECIEHDEPDSSDDPRYDCAGAAGCIGSPLAEWPFPAEWSSVGAMCLGCTTFEAEQEEWECTHDRGYGLDGDSLTLCKAIPPEHYCRECSEANEDGEWVQHIDGEGGDQ